MVVDWLHPRPLQAGVGGLDGVRLVVALNDLKGVFQIPKRVQFTPTVCSSGTIT